MMKMKPYRLILVVLAGVVLAAGCNNPAFTPEREPGGGNTAPPTSVTIDSDTPVLITGSTLALTASVLPANANQGIVWSSNNETVATVDKNGVVKAELAGKAVITATTTNSEVKNTLEVFVLNSPSPDSFDMENPGTVHLLNAQHPLQKHLTRGGTFSVPQGNMVYRPIAPHITVNIVAESGLKDYYAAVNRGLSAGIENVAFVSHRHVTNSANKAIRYFALVEVVVVIGEAYYTSISPNWWAQHITDAAKQDFFTLGEASFLTKHGTSLPAHMFLGKSMRISIEYSGSELNSKAEILSAINALIPVNGNLIPVAADWRNSPVATELRTYSSFHMENIGELSGYLSVESFLDDLENYIARPVALPAIVHIAPNSVIPIHEIFAALRFIEPEKSQEISDRAENLRNHLLTQAFLRGADLGFLNSRKQTFTAVGADELYIQKSSDGTPMWIKFSISGGPGGGQGGGVFRNALGQTVNRQGAGGGGPSALQGAFVTDQNVFINLVVGSGGRGGNWRLANDSNVIGSSGGNGSSSSIRVIIEASGIDFTAIAGGGFGGGFGGGRTGGQGGTANSNPSPFFLSYYSRLDGNRGGNGDREGGYAAAAVSFPCGFTSNPGTRGGDGDRNGQDALNGKIEVDVYYF